MRWSIALNRRLRRPEDAFNDPAWATKEEVPSTTCEPFVKAIVEKSGSGKKAADGGERASTGIVIILV
jgi:hypothetical protein